jgi:hypothetical protein
MIPKISRSGTSFKGLCQYLMHDPNAHTDDRVAWTHTHVLANDDVPSAINEMYLTAENAEFLKQGTGIRAGGRSTANPVKHISLNWHGSDNPSQQHMIKTADHFLESMGWGEHQAIYVAHSDKAHKHLHIVLNAVHPETGRHLSESWEHNRAQKWAAAYERAQDCIRCPQRLIDGAEREKSMPRNMRMAFQQNEKSFLRDEQLMQQNSGEIPENIPIGKSEWTILKNIQRSEREEFFADGKTQFSELRNTVYRAVRKEFRERWNDYYEMRREGADPEVLRKTKERIAAEQKFVLEPRRDQACHELIESRKLEYREILDNQREQRQTLRWHLALGHDTSDFFHELNSRREANVITDGFREAASEVTDRSPRHHAEERAGRNIMRDVTEIAEKPVAGVGSMVANIGESLFSYFTNLGSAKPEPIPQAAREEAFRQVAEDATKQREAKERALDDEEGYKRLRVLHGRE